MMQLRERFSIGPGASRWLQRLWWMRVLLLLTSCAGPQTGADTIATSGVAPAPYAQIAQ